MTPIDPDQAVPSGNIQKNLPGPPDELVNKELVEEGLNAAEDELRDIVADEEEIVAMSSVNPESQLDDIDRRDDYDNPPGPDPQDRRRPD